MLDHERAQRALRDIATDMKNDARDFDGKPFTGKVVAEYFGNQGAAIAALAGILQQLCEDVQHDRRMSRDGGVSPDQKEQGR